MSTPVESPWVVRAKVFEKSYNEVLAALKHQDDKLNRTLTALAFLTAAAIALFVNYAAKLETVRFPNEPRIPVTTFFFVTFLGSALFALLFALAAIGPSDSLPRIVLPKRGRQKQSTSEPSLLFYARILNDPNWSTYVDKDPDWLCERLARSLHSETETISQRIDYKIARSRESSACVQLAVLSLILLGVFVAGPLSLPARWWIAAALMIAVLVQPFWDGLLMWWFHFKDTNPMRSRWQSYTWTGIAVVAATAAIVAAPSVNGHWWALGSALGTILATRLALAHRQLAFLILPATAVGATAAAVLAWTA